LQCSGNKIDNVVVRKSAITPKEDGRWADTARFVMRKPISVVVLSLIILTVLAAPIKNIVFSQVDSRVLPASNPAATAARVILENFQVEKEIQLKLLCLRVHLWELK
jgi:RND superfamily putative drug exporter